MQESTFIPRIEHFITRSLKFQAFYIKKKGNFDMFRSNVSNVSLFAGFCLLHTKSLLKKKYFRNIAYIPVF